MEMMMTMTMILDLTSVIGDLMLTGSNRNQIDVSRPWWLSFFVLQLCDELSRVQSASHPLFTLSPINQFFWEHSQKWPWPQVKWNLCDTNSNKPCVTDRKRDTQTRLDAAWCKAAYPPPPHFQEMACFFLFCISNIIWSMYHVLSCTLMIRRITVPDIAKPIDPTTVWWKF